MNTTATDTAILKTDTLGRVKTPAARREQLLDEFERSGMSGVQFAEFVGVKYQTFATWAQHRRRKRKAAASSKAAASASASKQLRWMEAVIEQAQSPANPTSTPLVLHLPGGARVEITELKQVALVVALVRALAQSPLAC